jgi:hypothetical protein
MQPATPLVRRSGMTLPRSVLVAAALVAVTTTGTPAPAVRPVAAIAADAEAPDRPVPVRRTVVVPAVHVRDTRRGTPYFRTPQAAMRYLVRAYNRHDDKAIAHVTTTSARQALLPMRAYAPALALVACTPRNAGDYECSFTHTLAKPSPGHRHGHATFYVAPAYRHGWYMTVLLDCGDGE